jgi:hypothetical protein
MWVKVQRADEALHVDFGTLDSEPIAISGLRLGMELAVSYDNIVTTGPRPRSVRCELGFCNGFRSYNQRAQ